MLVSKAFIAMTSINPPTAAVSAFANLQDMSLIVAADTKTPLPWQHEGVMFLGLDQQQAMPSQLLKILPYKTYARKMAAYLWAMEQQAELILDTDDDNYPYPGFSIPDFNGCFLTETQSGFKNIYRYYSDQYIWPRGFPLNLIKQPETQISSPTEQQCCVGIWQGLADRDPDVDAIYRLLYDDPCEFKKNGSLVLAPGVVSPFNSQNTAFHKDFFALMYLPVTVSMRFTDILRGYVAQPILWSQQACLGFTQASVYQERNPHDYMQDFESEMTCFSQSERAFQIAYEQASPQRSIKDNLYCVYEALAAERIVDQQELAYLQAWLSDLETLNY